jgi:hypothetical protein
MASPQTYLYGITNIFRYFQSNHRKEKLDFVLEPLQALIQLCLLSFCQVGTKLTIQDNLLYIQHPGLSQGLIRYLNDDTKDDLYFLLNVFRRFLIYYDFLKQSHPDLYKLLIYYGQQGLDKLIQTYSDVNKVSLLHSLKMYKLILKNSDFFESLNNEYYDDAYDDGMHSMHNKENTKVRHRDAQENNSETLVFMNWFSQLDNHSPKDEHRTNFDNVFKEITKIYKNEYLTLYENILKSVILHKENIENTIEGTRLIFKPINEQIKKWINQHIAL